jgi:hypothetical protein
VTPEELVRAAETRLRDAENNLTGAIASMDLHKTKYGSIPNGEVVALVQVQAVVAQAYATLAMAKMLAVALAPEGGVPS